MRKFLIWLALIMAVLVVTGTGMAATFGDGGALLQKVFNDITLAPIPGTSSVNVLTDEVPDIFDSYWEMTAAGSSVAAMVIELATFAPDNKLGIYDPANKANTVDLFVGSSTPGDKAVMSIDLSGNVTVIDPLGGLIDSGVFSSTMFGFVLDSSVNQAQGGGIWYSDTMHNIDGMDHMYAYQGKGDRVQYPAPPLIPKWVGDWDGNEYALCFEDVNFNQPSDRNYTDMVVLVESIKPIPEPGTLLLLGLGLVGIAGISRKKFMD